MGALAVEGARERVPCGERSGIMPEREQFTLVVGPPDIGEIEDHAKPPDAGNVSVSCV